MESDLLTQLSEAVAGQNWIAVAAIALAIVVPLVLKVLGRDIPIVDPILRALVGWTRHLKGAKPAPKPEDQKGLAAVVEIKDVEKK